MTIIEERKTVQVSTARRAPAVEHDRRPSPPQHEPKRQMIRWLAWMAGVVLVAGLLAVMAALVSTGDEIDQAPVEGIELVTPSLVNIDPHESPEAFIATEATVATTPSLDNIDPRESPEVGAGYPVIEATTPASTAGTGHPGVTSTPPSTAGTGHPGVTSTPPSTAGGGHPGVLSVS